MKTEGRRQSKNVKKQPEVEGRITRKLYKSMHLNAQKEKAFKSEALKVKDLKRHKDFQTDIINQFNMTPDEQKENAKRLRQHKDTAKPQHLIPPSKKKK